MLQETIKKYFEIDQEIKRLNKKKKEYREFLLGQESGQYGDFDLKLSTHYRHELNMDELKEYLGDALDSFRKSKVSERITVKKLV